MDIRADRFSNAWKGAAFGARSAPAARTLRLPPGGAGDMLAAMSDAPVILAGIGGGIAAYKAVEVVSRLVQAGREVHVAMTAAARQFVTPTTFASVSRRRVITEMFPPAESTSGEALFPHIYPASHADVFVVMPATADLLAKLACGIGDDVVVCSALALRPETVRLLAPAMNEHMWRQPVVQRNLAALEADGWRRIGPAEGALACGTHGPGRMAEPSEILHAIESALAARSGALRGKRVLILSGPTREPLDPVRFLSNGSTGRMGKALAQAALAAGARVDFITGPVEPERWPSGTGLELTPVTTAAEMLAAARARAGAADLVIFAAAVSDFRPAQAEPRKRPKSEHARSLDLEPTPDIAAELARTRPPGQVTVGFALETDDGPAKARAKRAAKRFDLIVLNAIGAIGADTAEYTFISEAGEETTGPIPKAECARRILERAAALLKAETGAAVSAPGT